MVHCAAQPLVSIVMAFHNGAPYLRDAVTSVLAQSHGNLELLLCDDASTDDAPTIAQAICAQDPRARLLRSDRKSGPGAARNLGLDAARGDWLAIIDADDLVHPDRIAGLLDIARRTSGDVVADDLVPFGAQSGTTLLAPLALTAPWQPDAHDLLRAELGTPSVAVGYLKPLIRRASLGSLRYRTDLPIGEDFDLLVRLALSGARLTVAPEPWYLYRRHAASTSHRLTSSQAAAILTGIDALAADHPDWAKAATDALSTWRARTERTRAFGELVRTLKQRKVGRAMGMLRRTPDLSADLIGAMWEGIRRRARFATGRDDNRPLTLGAGPKAISGVTFEVPRDDAGWDGPRVAALARLTGTGKRHLRVFGRTGLAALGYVPGWRLAELVPPQGGWSMEEAARIDRMPWPVLQCRENEHPGSASHDADQPAQSIEGYRVPAR
jgi:succinoglycan biosynthesis protein ExoO